MDEVGLLTTEEVLDLKSILGLVDNSVDGEVIVHKSHLISVALLIHKIKVSIYLINFDCVENRAFVSQFII